MARKGHWDSMLAGDWFLNLSMYRAPLGASLRAWFRGLGWEPRGFAFLTHPHTSPQGDSGAGAPGSTQRISAKYL